MSRILINAAPEELRIGLLSNDRLDDFYYEHLSQKEKIDSKGNVFKGYITRVEPALEAVFVTFGGNRQGFLPFREISPEYYLSNKKGDSSEEGSGNPSVGDMLREKQEIMIQVMKEERGTKGAALTTYITLAGCYLVLMPNSTNAGGISRRIEGEERQEMKEILSNLTLPSHMSVIIRTAGVDKGSEDLQWDLNALLQQWESIQKAYQQRPAPFLIHQESDVTIRTIRDHLRKEVSDIIIDDIAIFNKAKSYIERVRPDYLSRLKLYQDEVPLFARYQIEKQVKSAFDHEIHLPSGGSLVIDRTEALISIDINSARATHGSNIEETALLTNLEAADEIARQLRLRDLGGLIVIDFIDMTPVQHQREVENRLREALKADRARIQIGKISRFGLLEMSRQRLHPTLGEAHQKVCPQCHGQGTIRSIEGLGHMILRVIEESALNGKMQKIRVQLPVEVATYLLNEKRQSINTIEQRYQVELIVLPNPYFVIPHYKIELIDKHQDISDESRQSYELISKPSEAPHTSGTTRAQAPAKAPAPIVSATQKLTEEESKPSSGGSIIKKLWTALFGTTPEAPVKKGPRRDYSRGRSSGGGGSRGGSQQDARRRHYRSRGGYDAGGSGASRGADRQQDRDRRGSPGMGGGMESASRGEREEGGMEKSGGAASSRGGRHRRGGRRRSGGGGGSGSSGGRQNFGESRQSSSQQSGGSQTPTSTTPRE